MAILNLESVSEALDFVESSELTLSDMKSLLKLRTDFDIKEIGRLKL